MKKPIQKYLITSLIYGSLMTFFNIIVYKKSFDLFELLGDFVIYTISFTIAYFLLN